MSTEFYGTTAKGWWIKWLSLTWAAASFTRESNFLFFGSGNDGYIESHFSRFVVFPFHSITSNFNSGLNLDSRRLSSLRMCGRGEEDEWQKIGWCLLTTHPSLTTDFQLQVQFEAAEMLWLAGKCNSSVFMSRDVYAKYVHVVTLSQLTRWKSWKTEQSYDKDWQKD